MRNALHDEPVGHPLRGPAFGERTDPATVAIVSAVGTGLGAVKSLMGTKAPSAPAPTITAPPLMPTPDDAAAQAAKRRSLEGQAQRRGRQSTILSDDTGGDLVGG